MRAARHLQAGGRMGLLRAARGVERRLRGLVLILLQPELRRRLPDLDSSPAMSPEAQRYRLFEAVAALLSTASRREPLLLA